MWHITTLCVEPLHPRSVLPPTLFPLVLEYGVCAICPSIPAMYLEEHGLDSERGAGDTRVVGLGCLREQYDLGLP